MTAEPLPPLTVLELPDTPATTRVRVEADRILVDRLVVADPALAAFLAERPADDRPDLVERAVRIGLLALQDAGVTVNVDVVRSEFEKLLRQAETVNDKAAAGARADPPRQLRRRRRPAAAHARALPR